jgi:hypothetical protein
VVPIWLMRSASMVRLSCICEITRDFLMLPGSLSCRGKMAMFGLMLRGMEQQDEK